MSDDLVWTSATRLAEQIRAGALSPVEIVDAVDAHIDAVDPSINAFLTRTPELARQAALAAQEKLVRDGGDSLGRLAGLPISIKDLTPTAGVRTTFGMTKFSDHVPEQDAPVAARVRGAGAALLGKTNTPPGGWLGVTENEVAGRTDNPWDAARTVGGSSGGSAAAVAAGFGPFATGSDGGGSVRVPAAFCGVTGYKPSHGRVPRGPEAPGFDTVDALGPLARTVEDVALLLDVMSGPHPGEPYMLPAEGVSYREDLRVDAARGLRLAFSPDLGHGPVDPQVARVVAAAVQDLAAALGAPIETPKISIPDPIEFFVTVYPPSMEAWLEENPDFADTFLPVYPELARLALNRRGELARTHEAAVLAGQQATFDGITAVFESADLLVLPTAPVVAFPHDGECGPRQIAGRPVEWPAVDFFRFTEPFGHSGHPALTLPCGFTDEGLPVGLQVVGPQRDDRTVLQAGAAYQAVTSWHQRRPA